MTDSQNQSASLDTPALTDWDRWLARPMFFVTLLYLSTAGIAVHLLSDEEDRYLDIVHWCGWVLVALTGVYVAELLIHWGSGGKHLLQNVLNCLLPPLRLGSRDHVTGEQLWLPGWGWKVANDELAKELQIKLGYPMIGIAFLILPLLGVEFHYAEKLHENLWLGFATKVAGTLIWLAFAMEYILMISLVSKKFQFAKKHWLDLAIICLPLIAFLRVARLGQVSRLMRMKQLGKLSRTARVFRLRGLAMRAWRAILILEIVDRLLHRDPQKRLRMLEDQLAEKMAEAEAIRTEIEMLESVLKEQQLQSQPQTQKVS